MLWFKKQSESNDSQSGNVQIEPAELKVTLDETICQVKLQQFLNAAEEKGGIDGFVSALNSKQELFTKALAIDAIDELDADRVDVLLDTVFTARRKLPEALSDVPEKVLVNQIKHLLYGNDPLLQRMDQFVALIDSENRKTKRAAWDFASELLHFSCPEKFPHMARWVWNQSDKTGAMREFIHGGDSLQDLPIGDQPEDFEAARVWFATQLGQQGFYRDIHHLIDLLIAQAYADYILSMSNGMGMFDSQFGADNTQPLDFVVKLLGIDPPRKKGLTRLKKAIVH